MPSSRVVRLGALLVGLAAAGCHASVGELAGSASDEWVRSYELAPEGEIQVTSTNGTIELEGYDGRTVEVRAQRTVKAVSDDAARDLVSRVGIEEEVTPGRVAIRTEGITGLLVGVSYQVTYHVKAPQSVVARLRATNGVVTVKAFAGQLIASSTNGGVVGENLGGRVEGRATNGHLRFSMNAVAPGGIRLQTTNGRVDLVVPTTAKADVSAECRNGTIAVDGLPFEPVGEQSRRTVTGRLNGGGAPIEVRTTNGAVRIRSQSAEP